MKLVYFFKQMIK